MCQVDTFGYSVFKFSNVFKSLNENMLEAIMITLFISKILWSKNYVRDKK